MKPDEWPAVAQRLDAAYPGFADDPQTSAVYIDVLADIDSAAVDQAVTELLREGREHPPPPGVIRARALGEPQAPPSDPGQTTRDRGARRGMPPRGGVLVHRGAKRFAEDGHGFNAQFLACADDPEGDFAAVGNENSLVHRRPAPTRVCRS